MIPWRALVRSDSPFLGLPIGPPRRPAARRGSGRIRTDRRGPAGSSRSSRWPPAGPRPGRSGPPGGIRPDAQPVVQPHHPPEDPRLVRLVVRPHGAIVFNRRIHRRGPVVGSGFICLSSRRRVPGAAHRRNMSRKTVTDGLVPTRYQTVFSGALPAVLRGPVQDELDPDARLASVRLAVVDDPVIDQPGAAGPVEVLDGHRRRGGFERAGTLPALPVVQRGLDRLAGAGRVHGVAPGSSSSSRPSAGSPARRGRRRARDAAMQGDSSWFSISFRRGAPVGRTRPTGRGLDPEVDSPTDESIGRDVQKLSELTTSPPARVPSARQASG